MINLINNPIKYTESIYNPSSSERINEGLLNIDNTPNVNIKETKENNEGIILLQKEYERLSEEINKLTKRITEVKWVIDSFNDNERDYIKEAYDKRRNLYENGRFPLNFYIRNNTDKIIPTNDI